MEVAVEFLGFDETLRGDAAAAAARWTVGEAF